MLLRLLIVIIILLLSYLGCSKGIDSSQPIKDKEKAASLSLISSNDMMVFIEAGEFFMGIDEVKTDSPFLSARTEGNDAKPMHIVYLDRFYMDKYEVTYSDFLKFMPEFMPPEGKPNSDLPVTDVTWFQAKEFCNWVGKRLPTEAEWEKAARGTDKRIYSWGNEFDPKKANLTIAPVKGGSFKTDVSPYGVYDMVGNVSEWTDSWYKPYPGSRYSTPDFGEKYRVNRGGSFNDTGHYFLPVFSQIVFRYYNPPDEGGMDNGFRCAR